MTGTSKKTTTKKTETETEATSWLDAIEVPDPLPESLGERKALVLGAIPTIPKLHEAKVKTKAGGGYSFKFVSHDQVAQIARPLFAKFGINYHATTSIEEIAGRRFVTLHATLSASNNHEDRERGDWMLPLPDGITPQEMGAILSYLTKYALQKTFLMDAGEEDLDSSAFGETGGGLPDRKRSSKPKDSTPPVEVSIQSKDIHPLAFGIPEGVWPKIAGLWHEHGTISEKQGRRLYALAGANEWSGDEMKTVLDHHLGVSIDAIAFGEPYDAIVATFQKFKPTRTAETQLDGAVASEDTTNDEPPDDDGYPAPPETEQDDIPF